MDFFASQERAERQTRLMLVMFLVAVALTVAALDLLAGVIWLFTSKISAPSLGTAMARVPAAVYWATTMVVLATIIGGTLHRMASLAGGGAAVAELVGARRVKSPGATLAEQQLVNVVEEMAIAAGIRVPLVYVMDNQRGINAFAAGYSPDQAAVTVTQGALEQLSRDELQGVVAHEFSHILNGDMRLNIRLVGVVAGLVFIGSAGSFMMQMGSGYDGDQDRFRSRGDIRLAVVGFFIWLIGSIGVLFGSLIKAAVSRQREFLADAAAVQFTRNPEGIGGALAKIGQAGSNVMQIHADELSHMYFGAAHESFFATHPPIEQRIERILGPGAVRLFEHKLKTGRITAPDATGAGGLPVTPAVLLASIGHHTERHVDYARQFIDELPAPLRRAVATQAGAKAALCALLLNDDEARQRQLGMIAAAENQMTADAAEQLAALLAPQSDRARIPVLTLAMESLRPLDVVERDALVRLVTDLVNADGRVTLREFVLLTICRSQLETSLQQPRVKVQTLREASGAAATLLALVARTAAVEGDVAAGIIGALDLAPSPTAPAGFSFPAVEAALAELKRVEPAGKRRLVDAAAQLVMADGHLTLAEGELLRAICAALEVPLPPILG